MKRTVINLRIVVLSNNDASGDIDDSAIFVLGNELPRYYGIESVEVEKTAPTTETELPNA